jgi:membrane-associated phospholipid phosphatase
VTAAARPLPDVQLRSVYPASLCDRLLGLDERLSERTYRAFAGQPGVCRRLLTGYTRLTQRPELWPTLAAILLLGGRHDRRRSIAAIAETAAGWGANSALKRIINRSRPPVAQQPPRSDADGASFPSTHAATGFAAAAAFSDLHDARSLYLLAASTALARLPLGEHYPSDLVVGAALGAAVGHTAHRAITRRMPRH